MSDTQNQAPEMMPGEERAELVRAIEAEAPRGWTEQEAGERMATLLQDDLKLAPEAAAPNDADASDANAEPTAPNEPRLTPRPVGVGDPWAEANEQAGTVDFLVGDEPAPVSIAELKAAIITAPDPEAAVRVVAHRMEMAKQSREISKLIPEWRDPARRQEIKADIVAYAKSKGYSDAEISQVYDARTLALAYRSMRAEQASGGDTPDTVTERPAAAPPRPATPKTAPTRRDAAADRLRKTGRLRDAAAVLERFVK